MREQALRTLRELASALSLAIDVLSAPEELRDLDHPIDFYHEVKRFEISLIKLALKKTQGSQVKAAQLLGLNQPTLHGKIKQYGIRTAMFREESSSGQQLFGGALVSDIRPATNSPLTSERDKERQELDDV